MTPSYQSHKTVWMLVEDDPALRAMLSAMLTIWNYEPLAFSDGHTAMKWLDDVEAGHITGPLPELALLDVRMPGPQGDEVAQRMRALMQTANIPVVVMTAYRLEPEELEEVTQRAQPDAVIRKPLPAPEQLREILQSVLDHRTAAA